jgi:DNA-binding transcriptional LysR family regulator
MPLMTSSDVKKHALIFNSVYTLKLMEKLIRELTLNDLRLLGALRGEKSLRSVARTMLLEPAAVSKRISRIEELFGVEILRRSARGFVFTGEGERLVEKSEHLLKVAEDIFGTQAPSSDFERVLTVGSRGFLNILLAEPLLNISRAFAEKTRLRFIDMSPQELQRAAMAGVVDLAVHFEEINWTSAWTTVKAAELNWKLFASSGHPLPSIASLAEVLKYPFIGPGSWNGEKLSTGDDGFPVPWRNRIHGHEVQTAMNALRIVQNSNQLVFLPDLMASEFLSVGKIKTVEVSDMSQVVQPLHVSVKSDRVSQKELQSFVKAVQLLTSTGRLNSAH